MTNLQIEDRQFEDAKAGLVETKKLGNLLSDDQERPPSLPMYFGGYAIIFAVVIAIALAMVLAVKLLR